MLSSSVLQNSPVVSHNSSAGPPPDLESGSTSPCPAAVSNIASVMAQTSSGSPDVRAAGFSFKKKLFCLAGVALGLALHTLIDGVALGAAMQAGASGNAPLGLVGLGVFAAIFLHKPLDSMSITSLMIAGGWNARSRLLVNLAFSVMCPLGALLFFAGIEYIPVDANWLVGITLAFSAGVFICISLSDLLPEVQFHSHDRARLTIALLAGVVAAYGVGLMEPEHDDFSHSPAVESHDRH